jgi:quinol monooxygenase YgiN
MVHIVLSGHIIIPMEELDKVSVALEDHKRLTRAEPGCLIFNIRPDADRLGWFKVYEKFSSQEAFDAHQARVAQSEWGAISKNVERHYKITEKETGE